MSNRACENDEEQMKVKLLIFVKRKIANIMKEPSKEWWKKACTIKLNPLSHSDESQSFDFESYANQDLEWWAKICKLKFPKSYKSSEYTNVNKGEWDKPWFKIGGPMNSHGGGIAPATWQGWLSFIIFTACVPAVIYLAYTFYPGNKTAIILAVATLILMMWVLVNFKGAGRYHRKKNGIKLKDSLKSTSIITWIIVISFLLYVAFRLFYYY